MRFFIALFCSVLALTAAATESEPPLREVSGQITVLDRMALPDDTMRIVDLTTAQDAPVLALRELTGGAQAPFDFVLMAPQDETLVLRVGLRTLDDVVWLSEPVAIAPGSDPVNTGPLRAPRIPQMGATALLSCGNQLVEAGMLPESMRIRLNEQVMTLTPQATGSGTLYVDDTNPATSLHLMDDDTALLRIDGAELSECTVIRPQIDITLGVWNISAIDDTPAMFPSRTELVFYPDGRMTASVGCNRLIGGYRRHGGLLSFGRLASTRMACPEGLDAQEARFTQILPKVDGYALDADAGRLLLTSGGKTVLRARR